MRQNNQLADARVREFGMCVSTYIMVLLMPEHIRIVVASRSLGRGRELVIVCTGVVVPIPTAIMVAVFLCHCRPRHGSFLSKVLVGSLHSRDPECKSTQAPSQETHSTVSKSAQLEESCTISKRTSWAYHMLIYHRSSISSNRAAYRASGMRKTKRIKRPSYTVLGPWP